MKACLKCRSVFPSSEIACPSCSYIPVRLNGIEAYAPELADSGGGFKPEYFSELAALEAANFWFRARNELITWALCAYSPDARNFLEVGCGTGFVLSGIAKAYPDIALSGSEIFLAGLAHAAERVPSAHFMQMDARHIPFVNEFDAIGTFDVLEHIDEDEAVLAQLRRALKPGGLLLLTVPQHPWLWSAADDYACHVRRYAMGELESKILAQGMRIERSTSFVSLLLPAMLLSRRKKKKPGAEHDVTAELRLPRFLNKCLYGVMQGEAQLVKLGLNLPIGGSRLIAARKVRE